MHYSDCSTCTSFKVWKDKNSLMRSDCFHFFPDHEPWHRPHINYWLLLNRTCEYQSLLFEFRLEKSCKSYQGSMGLDKAPYEKVPDSLAYSPATKVGQAWSFLQTHKSHKENQTSAPSRRITNYVFYIWYSCNCFFPCNNRTRSV